MKFGVSMLLSVSVLGLISAMHTNYSRINVFFNIEFQHSTFLLANSSTKKLIAMHSWIAFPMKYTCDLMM